MNHGVKDKQLIGGMINMYILAWERRQNNTRTRKTIDVRTRTIATLTQVAAWQHCCYQLLAFNISGYSTSANQPRFINRKSGSQKKLLTHHTCFPPAFHYPRDRG